MSISHLNTPRFGGSVARNNPIPNSQDPHAMVAMEAFGFTFFVNSEGHDQQVHGIGASRGLPARIIKKDPGDVDSNG